MKRFTLFAIAAISLVLTSCSKDQISSEKGNGNRTFSMTLNASVNETKATLNDAWMFAFSTGDKISLTNNQVTAGTYYELTRGSDGNFTGDVTAPTSAADWYAYYPSSSVSLANQTGTKTETAAYCALAGKQENVAADSKNLNISLSFQTAILVVGTKTGTIDINVKTSDDKWVSGFAAKANDATFDVTKSAEKVSLLNKSANGTYYVVVPAGIKIAVYDGETRIKETKEVGLSAGKYYIFVESYTVTFDLNGITGTVPTQLTIEEGGKVPMPTDPIDANHTFAGWYKTKDATTGALSDPWDFDNDTVTADMTLYAKWTRTLGSIYGTNENVPKSDNNSAPDNAWKNGDGGKAFIAHSGKTTEVLYLYKQLEPSGAKQLSCRKTENFTKIGDDYVLDYYLSSSFFGKYTLHMTGGKFTSVTYDGTGTDYEALSGTYAAPPAN